ncbi:Uncharacterised protein [Mycobacteroides abscessus subsp. abscessus]|nr:Uncharacterised protein [Mycobacteroides abscessus subsp. abscessus]
MYKRLNEACFIRDKPEIAGERQAHPGPCGNTIYCCNDRLFTIIQLHDHRVVPFPQNFPMICVFADTAQILP